MLPQEIFGKQIESCGNRRMGCEYVAASNELLGSFIIAIFLFDHSTDALQEGHSPAAMLAFHAKPIDGLRIGASYFYDRLETNTPGSHSGHGIAPGFSRATVSRLTSASGEYLSPPASLP